MSKQRPVLGVDEKALRQGHEAVDRFIEELQSGWDRHDAEISNRHFSENVLWGSPYGESVHGYEALHTIHTRLKAHRMGGSSSRYELVGVVVPTPDVAVAQVRRVALDDGVQPKAIGASGGSFSEMALYVLVRHDKQWWLAAGQNTPIRDLPSERSR